MSQEIPVLTPRPGGLLRVVLPVGSHAVQPEAQSFPEAREALLEQARRHFEQLLAIDPEHAPAHYNPALVFAQQGDQGASPQQRALHQKYRTDDAAIEQAVTRHRSDHAAADHAAAEPAIYTLPRPDDSHLAAGVIAPVCNGGPT